MRVGYTGVDRWKYSAAGRKDIEVISKTGDESFTIYADPGKMERVIGELIGNAIKYTPENRIVSVWLESGEGDAPPEPEKRITLTA